MRLHEHATSRYIHLLDRQHDRCDHSSKHLLGHDFIQSSARKPTGPQRLVSIRHHYQRDDDLECRLTLHEPRFYSIVYLELCIAHRWSQGLATSTVFDAATKFGCAFPGRMSFRDEKVCQPLRRNMIDAKSRHSTGKVSTDQKSEYITFEALRIDVCIFA